MTNSATPASRVSIAVRVFRVISVLAIRSPWSAAKAVTSALGPVTTSTSPGCSSWRALPADRRRPARRSA